MLTEGTRPRQLHWYHAGPMLFGDWGTSRLYVLGLALYYTHHAALWFMLAMSGLLIAVGWAYLVICRLHPDGGGVYSSARERSQTLAVVGALLLCADYVVTAALSALDAFHYAGFANAQWWAAGSIFLIGVINYFGPTKAGTIALVVAVVTIVASAIVGGAALPHLGAAHVEAAAGDVTDWWRQFTALILAISGVEAVANMTGIMVHPVEKTSRRAIWPVLMEIVILNLVLTAAMLAVPADILGNGDVSRAFIAHRDTMMKLLAEYYVGPGFAQAAAIVFALLLLSAVNTAVTDLVSIQYMLARDKELPAKFGGLNGWGMPVVPLVIGVIVPTITVLAVPDVGSLADLYAIGVVGAVAVNLGSCSTNFGNSLGRFERLAMMTLAVLMIVMWITIAITKPLALAFAGSVMGLGFLARYVAHHRQGIFAWFSQVAPVIPSTAGSVSRSLSAFLRPTPRPAELVAPAETRILIATAGNDRLVKFAIEECQLRKGELYVLFVRHIAVGRFGSASSQPVESDEAATALFERIANQAQEQGITVHFLYAVSYDIADTILEMAVTHAVDFVILGATQRGALWRTMKGDVIREVAEHLPGRISLLLHS